jgi:hypothetical protein
MGWNAAGVGASTKVAVEVVTRRRLHARSVVGAEGVGLGLRPMHRRSLGDPSPPAPSPRYVPRRERTLKRG